MMLRRVVVPICVLMLLMAPVPALAAALHALLIGIDDYAHSQDLRGSVNDVRDLERVVRANGPASLQVLTDADATAPAFTQSWQRMVNAAEAGDILLLTFSGHGIRVPEEGRRTTPDGYEKGFLLHGYDATRAPDEILRDEQLYDLFAAAHAKGLKIVFVADACHSGAAVRSADPRAGNRPFRFQRFDITPVVQQQPEEAVAARPPIPGLTVFSATVPQLSIQEVIVDGQYRGALSYAVARALEGAGGDETGAIRAAGVREFAAPLVRLLTGNRQIPQFTLPEPQLELARAGGEVAGTGKAGGITLAVAGGSPGELTLEGAEIVASVEDAELVWDAQNAQLLTGTGDVLANDVAADGLQHAVAARRLLNRLRAISTRQPGPVEMTVVADRGNTARSAFFIRGTHVRFTVKPRDLQFVTLFNLSASGTVHLIWPIAQLGDPAMWQDETPLSLSAPVSPPYGADYVVAVLSRTPLTALQAILEEYHGKPAPLPVLEAVLDARRSADIRVGIESVYTCAYLKENGQCDSMLVSP